MSQITKQLALRLPLDLHGKVVAAANENNRSGHAEMLHRLEESFEVQPVVAEEVVAQIFSTVAAKALTTVITGCFTKLEERVAQILETPPLYSITPAEDLSKEGFEALRDQLKAEGQYARLSDLYQRHFQRFDSSGRPGAASPTGRLSESQPELQDLPAVSGINTLPAAILRQGYRYVYHGDPAELVSKPFHTGGYTGLPEGERPRILEKGEPVLSVADYQQIEQRAERNFQSTVTVFNHALLKERGWADNDGVCPVESDAHVELLFRGGGDSAVVKAGNVRWERLDNEKVDISYWRLAEGEQSRSSFSYRVQDMPLPKASDADPDGWIRNTRARPVAKGKLVQVKLLDGRVMTDEAGSFAWEPIIGDGAITHWRLAATISDQAFAVEPPKEGEWIENTGSRPVERDIRVDVKFEDGGSYASKMAGDWHWKPHADRRFNITHWRLAE